MHLLEYIILLNIYSKVPILNFVVRIKYMQDEYIEILHQKNLLANNSSYFEIQYHILARSARNKNCMFNNNF